MSIKNMLRAIFLVSSLFAICIIPVSAQNGNIELRNVSFISDIGQIIASDALTLVNGSQLEISGNPYYMDFFWSPDGTRVLILAAVHVYPKGRVNMDKKGSIKALYLMNGDGSEITRISWGGDTLDTNQQYEVKFIGRPKWSPSGDVFSYTETSKEHVTFGESQDIFLFIVDVKNLKVIEEKKVPAIGIPILEWSPKEDSLLYLGLDEQYKPTVFLLSIAKNVTENSPINKYKKRRQFTNGDFVWSPDGKKIGFGGKGGLFVLDVDTNEIRNLFSTDNSIIFYKASWSPDSSKLIMSEIKGSSYSYGDALYDVYVIDMDSGESKKLTTFESGSSGVQGWFPDSNSILYKSFSSGTKKGYRIYSISAEGDDVTPLFSGSDNLEASISPSGEFIGVVLGLPGREIDKFILMNKDGSNKMQSDIKKGGFRWHGSDELLLEKVNENQSNSLVIINISTNETRQIPLKDSYIDQVSWSPGGRYLIVNSDILELAGYEIPMRIEVTGQPLTVTVVNISVSSTSGGVNGAAVTVNRQQIGTTNEKGMISYRPSGKEEILIAASKKGYSDAQRTIKIVDQHEDQHDKTGTATQTSVPAEDSTELPGFSALYMFISLISSSFLLTVKRKFTEVNMLEK